MNNKVPENIGHVADLDSSGWEVISGRFAEIVKDFPRVKTRLFSAKIGFDLGSSIGQSAYALRLLCRNLSELYCVDNLQRLLDPFKTALQPIVIERPQTMEDFLAQTSTKPELSADVIMIASLQRQPFFEAKNLRNLALSHKPRAILLEYNSDFSFSLNEVPMTEFFNPIYESEHLNIWQRK